MSDINKNLKLAILLTSFVFLLEFVGGIRSNSLALLSDAAHVLTDAVALLLTYGAIRISARPSNRNMTFGYHRFEIFAALINGLTIIVVAVFIFSEAYARILNPPAVRGFDVLIIAITGLVINSWVALKLRGHQDLNIKGAYLHVLGDAFASLAVIAGAIVIVTTGRTMVDPILSILIGMMLLYGAFKLVIGSARILLEFAPKHVDADMLAGALMEIDGIKGVHDIHIWSICSNIHAMSAHVLVDRIRVQQTEILITKISEKVRDRFRIMHTTLQFECAECAPIEIGHQDFH